MARRRALADLLDRLPTASTPRTRRGCVQRGGRVTVLLRPPRRRPRLGPRRPGAFSNSSPRSSLRDGMSPTGSQSCREDGPHAGYAPGGAGGPPVDDARLCGWRARRCAVQHPGRRIRRRRRRPPGHLPRASTRCRGFGQTLRASCAVPRRRPLDWPRLILGVARASGRVPASAPRISCRPGGGAPPAARLPPHSPRAVSATSARRPGPSTRAWSVAVSAQWCLSPATSCLAALACMAGMRQLSSSARRPGPCTGESSLNNTTDDYSQKNQQKKKNKTTKNKQNKTKTNSKKQNTKNNNPPPPPLPPFPPPHPSPTP